MDWPGNIRELSNFVERQFILNESDTLDTIINSNSINGRSEIYSPASFTKDSNSLNMNNIVSSVEASLIKRALKESPNTKEAAKLLGISKPTFSRKFNKYKNMNLL